MIPATQHPTYDALIVVSFGGPEGMADVMPFLENVLRGRNVPEDRMLSVAKHYEMFGGVSPINAQNRKLIAALEQELQANGPLLPIYFGNRNWHPLLADTVRTMRDDGVRNALAFVTSAYSSYSSCRQYLNDIEGARETVGADAPRIDKLRAFYNHPLFIEANAGQVGEALKQISPAATAPHLIFTAHSIPDIMAQNCDYQSQLLETAQLVADEIAKTENFGSHQLVFQSRSGPPSQPWLEPDICDYLRTLPARGISDVVISPVGFVSDHMEIIYDLDTEAAALCRELGLNMVRAPAVGTHPAFVRMIRELILERTEPGTLRRSVGAHGSRHDVCAPGCCLLSK